MTLTGTDGLTILAVIAALSLALFIAVEPRR